MPEQIQHVHPSVLLPPAKDQRDREDPTYLAHERRLTIDIRKRGVRHAIYAMQVGQKLQVLTGETRRRASLSAGVETVPVIVLQRQLSEGEILQEQLLENELRANFTPLELASIYQRLMHLHSWSQSELSTHVRASKGQIAKVLAISSKLGPEVRELVSQGKLSPRSAYAISRLSTHLQSELARKAAELPMAAESVEESVKTLLGGKQRKSKSVKAKSDGVTFVAPGDWTWDKVRELAERLKNAAARGEKMGAPISFLANLLKGC